MSDASEDIAVANENALAELAWAIEASEGQFSLFLARCNYAHLQKRIMQRLKELYPLNIRVITLTESDRTLYTTIRAQLGKEVPAALMVCGLDAVDDLDQVLSATNLVREEFRKNFPFPLVLWVSEDVHNKLVELAPDFESWATTTRFAIATDALIDYLQQKTDSLFIQCLKLGDMGSVFWPNDALCGAGYSREIHAALRDLQNIGQDLEPSLQASVEFALGRDAQASDEIDAALKHYQQSLDFWQHQVDNPQRHNSISQTPNPQLRKGIVLYHIGLCYAHKAEEYPPDNDSYRENWEQAKQYLEQCIDVFEQAQRQDLVAQFINKLGEVLQNLEEYEHLPSLIERRLALHTTFTNPVLLAEDYGFIAEVALHECRWEDAKQAAREALDVIAQAPEEKRQHQNRYRLLLAKSQQQLGQQLQAIKNLEKARENGPQDKPELYIEILKALRSLYFEQQMYQKAFEVKQECLSIEQQYGYRAFIGAGWLKPQQQVKSVRTQRLQAESQETVAPEIRASGRQQDLNKLIEKIRENDYKLIVIHGQSGVGKSSLVSAGLVPALKHEVIDIQEILPVLMRVYTDWVRELGQLLTDAFETKNIQVPTPLDSTAAIIDILQQLEQSKQYNLRIVLIFDQFEEFFFNYRSKSQQRDFFEFLGECLNPLPVKLPVKAVLSLRRDYLYYLLEGNDLPQMKIINNDILSKNVLHPLENFSPDEAHSIIKELTERSSFHLEPALIEALVQELAGDTGEVRPIELQVVGAQLQTDKIKTMAQYQELGSKEELVKHYLNEVVEDCGAENQKAAEQVLYLLTDENYTRPLKTRADLEKELKTLTTALSEQASQLDVVLDIVVKSGLVLLLPEIPAHRYQLVHDYLATFIRRQQEPKINELRAELEKEKEQRMIAQEQQILAEVERNLLDKWIQIIKIASLLVVGVMTVMIVVMAVPRRKSKKNSELPSSTLLRISQKPCSHIIINSISFKVPSTFLGKRGLEIEDREREFSTSDKLLPTNSSAASH